jgi:predicted ATP-dependent endonuclease of OLD family
VSDINEVEKKIETATAPKEKLQELIKKLYSGNKAINFEDKGITVRTLDNKNIGLQFLSSGEKQVLRIFIETLRAESNSIFVDEPELSLHIDWQKQLIADMQLLNPNTQIIFATHSPEIMAEVDDNRIFRL